MYKPESYPAFVRQVIQSNFEIKKGVVLIEGIPVTSIAEQYGTPLYVYSRKVLDERISDLRHTYPEGFRIHYSIKANPNPAIIRYFVSKDFGLEIASSGEYERALAAGCNPERIIFAGPGKTYAELEKVITRGIGGLHLESLREAKRAGEIASRRNEQVNVAIRINPEKISAGAMRMGGKPTQFGIDEEQLDTVLDFVSKHPQLEFSGIHIFIGTQILDVDALLAHCRKGFDIALKVGKQCGRPIRILDFGGGLGIPYFPGDNPLDLEALKRGLEELIREVTNSRQFKETQFVIEPGRFLVGESGIYIARVNDVKTSKGRTFVVMDGGMNHHLAASGNLGQTIKRNFPIAILNKCDSDTLEPVDLVGPLCTPLDTLGRQALLPCVTEGDLIGIFQSGAYARSASPLGFLSHAEPDEVFVENGACRLISKDRVNGIHASAGSDSTSGHIGD